ncbi:hypothetical protein JL100_030360 (plasmid) [Skermanella mucosa]|uniref:hypothetical protein n=1 Tax=Skermanella mucosa TaxID=1789672 RepID=UPI00192BE741|nr:hypothetical protein [Skermanella mucosa]UEM24531.1 hypothetical protein JL100_030360 [Skermanella mucosa]
MTEIPIDQLLTAPDDGSLMRIVYAYGLDAVLNGLFDEGVRVQYTDPDRAVACADVFGRIQQRTMSHR